MNFNTKWDIKKYKNEYESEEQWDLRKRFMLTYKNEFSEDRLACLTQTFLNIEFLRCRYPEETMEQIEELSKDIVAEYRIRKRARLQPTLVEASEAAASSYRPDEPSTIQNDTELDECLMPSSSSDLLSPEEILKHKEEAALKQKIEDIFNKKSDLGLGFDYIVVIDSRNVVPINILEQSSSLANVKLVFLFTKTITGVVCEVIIDGQPLGQGSGNTQKASKSAAAKIAVDLLRKYHYTLEKKCSFFNSGEVLNTKSGSTVEEKPIPEDNVGLKMMLKMGWTGSGLGQSQQGIVTPVKPTATATRAGLGTDGSLPSRSDMYNKFHTIFEEFAASDSRTDLVFSTDLSSPERKLLHELAHKFHLKSQSFGKDNDRHLVVSKPFQPLKIVKDMMFSGCFENEKYILNMPSISINGVDFMNN